MKLFGNGLTVRRRSGLGDEFVVTSTSARNDGSDGLAAFIGQRTDPTGEPYWFCFRHRSAMAVEAQPASRKHACSDLQALGRWLDENGP